LLKEENRKVEENPPIKILKALAFNTELEQYKMPKETGLSYRTILRNLKPLEDMGDIKLLREEASEKGGKDKKIYSLTYKGLHWCIAMWAFNHAEKIITAHSDKLLTFKKWQLFKEAGVSDHIKDAVRIAFGECMTEVYLLKKEGYDIHLGNLENETNFREAVDRNLLLPLVTRVLVDADTTRPFNYEAFKKVCKNDLELNTFIEQELEKEISKKEKTLRQLQNAKVDWGF